MAGPLESSRPVRIPAGAIELEGNLAVPSGAAGVVVFAHGSGSSRLSPRNRHVAAALERGGLATLLLDLLSPEEDRVAHTRFEIGVLAGRLSAATDWAVRAERLPVGLFGASTGAAAALVTAAERPETVRAVVSRGGRPDLAGDALHRACTPTLLIVGGNDREVLRANQQAVAVLPCERLLEIIPGATHLFEEPGALDKVAALARDWFQNHLAGRARD